MNVLIIIGHPNENSFNHAIANTCKTHIKNNGHQVFYHDLYKEQFNPVGVFNNLDLALKHKKVVDEFAFELKNSDGIIIIHPNWWGQPPAIIKGWLDQVMLPDIAYRFEVHGNSGYTSIGLLKDKIAMVFNTSNTSEELENEVYKDPLETIWKNRVFGFCGVKLFERRNFKVIKDSSLQERTNWLLEVSLLAEQYFPR
ncbi:MAG: NAD(P)H-dependent oxidoreductase [Bacteroidota bacterium]